MTFIMQPNQILPFKYSIWLTISSFSFMIPAVYAFTLHLWSYGFLYFSTAIASINYWRKATYGSRRDVDVIVSRISFIITFATGLRQATLFGWFLVFMIVGLYTTSVYLHTKSSTWIVVHGCMHISSSYAMCYCIKNKLTVNEIYI